MWWISIISDAVVLVVVVAALRRFTLQIPDQVDRAVLRLENREAKRLERASKQVADRPQTNLVTSNVYDGTPEKPRPEAGELLDDWLSRVQQS